MEILKILSKFKNNIINNIYIYKFYFNKINFNIEFNLYKQSEYIEIQILLGNLKYSKVAIIKEFTI